VDEDIEDTDYVDVTKTVFSRVATREDKYIRKTLRSQKLAPPFATPVDNLSLKVDRYRTPSDSISLLAGAT
jgi:hypothetical protein